MKIETAAVSTSVDTNNAFTIAATGKAFKILSDGLYSDKVGAVIRELSCNAYDSHVAIGKPDMPFEIHLPSINEPWFSVTDFGTGISDADVYDIYTRYFSSTKTNSNDFVGQLGLGSKSPFSLVREFKVYSRYKGTQRTYRMYFDDTDTPRVECVSELNCAAHGLPHSGVKVELDLQYSNSRRLFSDSAKNILKWFSTIPTITGEIVHITSLVNGMHSDGWKIRENLSSRVTYTPTALMGNVAYPIEFYNIHDATDIHRDLLELPIIIKFDIGDIEVSASRESIGYDKRTVENIIKRLDTVADSFNNFCANEIGKCKTEWDARSMYHVITTTRYGSNSSSVSRLLKTKNVEWNGVKIESSYKSVKLADVYEETTGNYRVHIGHTGKTLLTRLSPANFTSFLQKCDTDNLVVFNDVPKAGLTRIRAWLKTNTSDKKVTVYSAPEIVDWDELTDLLGNPTVVLASTMPELPKKETVKTKMMLFTQSNGYGPKAWVDAEIDLDEGGFYIDTIRKEAVSGMRTVDLSDILHYGKAAGYLKQNVKVYSPKGTFRNKFANLDNWINIVDFLVEKVNTAVTSAGADYISTIHEWKRREYEFRKYNLGHYAWLNLRDTNSQMKKFINLAKDIATIAESPSIIKTKSVLDLAKCLRIVTVPGTPDPRIDECVKDVMKIYPLFEILNDQAGKHFDKVVDYVNLVDLNYVWYSMLDPVENETN